MDLNWILNILTSPYMSLLFLSLVGYFCWHNVYDYNDLPDCVTVIGANEGTIFITEPTDVTDDLTIPLNITLRIIQGGTLNVSATKTVTINGHIEAGLYQIFEGAGIVVFGSGSVEEIYPEWWGDTTAGWNSMVTAINTATSMKISLSPNKIYTLGNVSTFDQLNGFILDFNGATIKVADGTEVGVGKTGYALRFTNCDNITINSPKINGNRENLDYAAGGDGQAHGIFVQYSRNVLITNPDVYDCGTDGLYFGATTGMTTERSQRIKVDGGRVYRCRRNNITVAGALDVSLNLKENTHAGEDVGASAGTAPKSGIDLEANAGGVANQNENTKIGGTKFSDNVTTDIVTGQDCDGVFIDDNEFETDIGAASIFLKSNIKDCHIKTNKFSGGTYHIIGHNAYAYDGLEISGNITRNATVQNIYIVADSLDNLQYFGNTIIADQKAFYLNPTASINWHSNKVHNNTYVLNDDNEAADADAITLRRCAWENDTIIRKAGVANNYRINIARALIQATNIECFNANIEIYDTGGWLSNNVANIHRLMAGVLEYRGAAAPVAGSWARLSKILDTTPDAGGRVGWICTTSGVPGTWKEFGIIDPVSFNAPVPLTIAGGVITVTKSYHILTPQGGAVDDLDTINGGVDGMLLVLSGDGTFQIDIKHLTGNIDISGAADYLLPTTTQRILLQYDVALTKWIGFPGY